MPVRIRIGLSISMPIQIHIRIRILPQVLQLLENRNFFYLQFLRYRYSRKRYLYGNLASNSDVMDKDPDWRAIDADTVPARSDRIRVRNTDILQVVIYTSCTVVEAASCFQNQTGMPGSNSENRLCATVLPRLILICIPNPPPLLFSPLQQIYGPHSCDTEHTATCRDIC